MDEQWESDPLYAPPQIPLEIRELTAARARPLVAPGQLAFTVVVVGLIITALVTWVLWQSYNDNEDKLVRAKAKEAAALISQSTPNIQTPLAAAAELADADGGNAQQFMKFMGPFVGPGLQFVSASLWNLNSVNTGPVARVGEDPELRTSPQAAAFFSQIANSRQRLELVSLKDQPNPRIGYEYRPGGGPYAVYAETPLPPDKRAKVARNSAFSDIHYAIYFGRAANPDQLVATDLDHPIGNARHATEIVPFGAGAFTVVVSPTRSFVGSLAAALPWLVAAVGSVLSLVGALIGHRLQRRRREAEMMAVALNRAVSETSALYAQQRSVAHHLERSLLPQALPDIEGLESSCRYEPGTAGVEIGGDWYDLVPLGNNRAFFLIGDVSGRGVAAAAVMGRLRFTVLAYLQVGFAPDAVLGELSKLITMEEFGHFATVVCGVLDLGSHELSFANAGHLPPLLIAGHTTTFLSEGVGVPVGVSNDSKYELMSVKVPPSGTLLVYTDGLVERRTERIEVGLNRLAGTALQYRTLRLDTQVNKIVEEMTRPGSEDDAALLGIRWQS